jgi:hypothetical protein
MKEEHFDEIRRISFQEIKNGGINLQKIGDKLGGEKLFFSHLACTDTQRIQDKRSHQLLNSYPL